MITLYSTHCPRCNVLEKKLERKGIEFELNEDIQILIEKGFTTAPVLEVDGKFMNFMEANKWIADN